MWHCLSHRFLWASVLFVELEFAKFVAKISNWNFLVVSFFPCWNICAEEDCLSVDFKHVNSSFAVAFILLCQKRENLTMCHQPIVPPKLPFTTCKLFTILQSLPLCNKPTYTGWQSSCRLFTISNRFGFVFVAYIAEYVTADCQVFHLPIRDPDSAACI